MNKVILMGRLTNDPEIRYAGETAVARFRLAVDRRWKRDGEPTADFLNMVAFGKSAEFAEKYLVKGTKIVASGRIQTGNYKKSDGSTAYTTDIVIEEMEFAESKHQSQQQSNHVDPNGFMNIPDGIDEELPFS